jgi:hypothetical protein
MKTYVNIRQPMSTYKKREKTRKTRPHTAKVKGRFFPGALCGNAGGFLGQ